jgi:hypothetical protein
MGVSDGVCESCAREDDDLVAVHRVYLSPDTPGPDGTPAASTMVDVELWCFSCRSMYPHELSESD